MFHKLLIANRGEIAVRIIRACKELGVKTVAVYSEADRDSLHVRWADEAVYIGPPPAPKSYLHIPHIISAAVATGADAIHPGYGFLAENPFFSEVCNTWGIKFVGPSPEAIRRMGVKSLARTAMQQAGVPVVPGSEGSLRDVADALAVAQDIGYPVLVKADYGGGGRGIRIAADRDALREAWDKAQSEANATFGRAEVFVEKYLETARHIEVQVLGDQKGNLIHLGERECSLQRRRQKLLEESPSPGIDADLRARICAAAVRAAEAVGYSSAGTCEFLVAPQGDFYFIEMNARIQVEHPVTELVTGVDIVREQIRIAAGEPLRLRQQDVHFRGHAIECRVTAEDPERGLLPAVGQIAAYEPPSGPGVRVDSAAYQGYQVTPYYDSLIAKLIVWAEDRDAAIARAERALAEFRLEGVKTSLPVHRRIVAHPDFRSGRFDTMWLEKLLAEMAPRRGPA